MDDVTLYEAYFQKSKSYYLNRLDWYLKGQKYSFNLFAFLFGLFWFMYRKMYLEAAVIFLAMMVEGFLESLILPTNSGWEIEKLVNIISTFVIASIAGLVGNYFYFRKAGKVIERAKMKFAGSEQQISFLKERGGVSYFFLVIIFVCIVALFAYDSYSSEP